MNRTLKQISLQPDDVLFLLHMPKTGGTSLMSILESQFQPDQICPLHTFATRDKFAQFTPQQLGGFRLVRGHMRVGSYSPVFQYVTQNPICLTMLREPIERVVSEYDHIRRDPENWLYKEFMTNSVSLKEYVTNEKYAYLASNYQVFMITGTVQGNIFMDKRLEKGPLLSDEARLALAKQRLEQYVFVGLTERYPESVELLNYTFGWEPMTEIPFLNTAPKKTSLDQLDAATLQALEACTEGDRALYAFAQELFAERYGQMKATLLTG